MSVYPAGTVGRELLLLMRCPDPGCAYAWESPAVDELGFLSVRNDTCPVCRKHGQVEGHAS